MLGTARPLFVAVAAVVTAFVLSLWLSQHRLSDVETNVYQVAATAEPSVVHLENARAELDRMGLSMDEYIEALRDDLPAAHAARVRASEAHARLMQSLRAYEQLPFFPGEEALYREAQASLRSVERAVRALEADAEAGSLDSAALVMFSQLHPAMEEVDAKLEALVSYDTGQAVRRLQAIAASRRDSWRAALVGGVASFVLSVVATALAACSLLRTAAVRREMHQEQGARMEAQQEVRRRDQFLSLVAHELRTPLATLQLAVDALAKKPDGSSQTLCSSAVRQVGRMAALVEELVLVAQLDLGSVALQPAPVELVAVVRDRIQAQATSAQQAGSTVSLHGEAPVLGRWDASALGQVVDKLLANAVRFGEGHPIHVTVSQHDGKARLVVHDRGIGIPPGRLAAVFERFERGVSERNYPGLGLGLFIARSLVQCMGGEIAATSSPAEGTTFTVELPLQAAPVKIAA